MQSKLPFRGLLVLSASFFAFSVVTGACAGGSDGSTSSTSSSSSGGTVQSSSDLTAGSSTGTSGGSSTGATSHAQSHGGSSSGGTGSSFNTSGFLNPDGGLSFDAGFEGYMGTPEEGTNCGGATTCTTTETCCIGFSGGMCAAMCQGFSVGLTCDGPEDCDTEGGEVCCFALQGGGHCKPKTDCARSGGATGQTWLCNTSADCDENSGCCRSSFLESYEIGQCIDGCNVSQ